MDGWRDGGMCGGKRLFSVRDDGCTEEEDPEDRPAPRKGFSVPCWMDAHLRAVCLSSMYVLLSLPGCMAIVRAL